MAKPISKSGTLENNQDQVSRIFFGGKHIDSGYQGPPSYGAPASYGPPPSYAPPPQYSPGIDSGVGVGASLLFGGNEFYLTLRLGQAALIIFMVSAIVLAVFLLILLCFLCSGQLGGKRETKYVTHTATQQPFVHSHVKSESSCSQGYPSKSLQHWKAQPLSSYSTSRGDQFSAADELDRRSDRDTMSSPSASMPSDPSPDLGSQPPAVQRPPPPALPDDGAREGRRRSRSHTPSRKQSQMKAASGASKDDSTAPWPNVKSSDLQKVRGSDILPQAQPPLPPLPPPPAPMGPKPSNPLPLRQLPSVPGPQHSNSERSLPRSLPFYEVPAPRITYISGPNESLNYTPYQNTELFNPPARNSTFALYDKDYSRPDKSRLI